MARKLIKKDILVRIKANKAVMNEEKKIVVEALKSGSKGDFLDAVEVRAALASFIKASKAVRADTAKLELAE